MLCRVRLGCAAISAAASPGLARAGDDSGRGGGSWASAAQFAPSAGVVYGVVNCRG